MQDFYDKLPIVTKENEVKFNYPGVWALFGKRISCQNKNSWYCLQVATTENIKNEISKDRQLLDVELNMKRPDKKYINQFREEIFSYPDYPSPREYLYSDYIKTNFEHFRFVVICKEEDSKIRRNIEKEVAYRTQAICWRNGRSFMKGGKEIDFEKRVAVSGNIPNNKKVSQEVITPLVNWYNKQL